jgi:hypothetical protein
LAKYLLKLYFSLTFFKNNNLKTIWKLKIAESPGKVSVRFLANFA